MFIVLAWLWTGRSSVIDCRPKGHQTTSNASSSLYKSIFPRSGQNKTSLRAWEILDVNYGPQRNLSLDFLNTCPEFIIGVYFKSNATGHAWWCHCWSKCNWKVNFNCIKIVGAERNNEWRWVERWKHFSRKFYLSQEDSRSTGLKIVLYLFWLTKTTTIKQIYKNIETKQVHFL